MGTKTQDRGAFWAKPGDEVYEDQIIGIHAKDNDLKVNVCKAKQLTNMRSSGADEKSTTTPPMQLTLEDAVEYVVSGEFVEVTPDAIRMGMFPKASRFAKKRVSFAAALRRGPRNAYPYKPMYTRIEPSRHV